MGDAPTMDGIAKYLSSDIPVLQITWARYFFTVVFTLPIIFHLKNISSGLKSLNYNFKSIDTFNC